MTYSEYKPREDLLDKLVRSIKRKSPHEKMSDVGRTLVKTINNLLIVEPAINSGDIDAAIVDIKNLTDRKYVFTSAYTQPVFRSEAVRLGIKTISFSEAFTWLAKRNNPLADDVDVVYASKGLHSWLVYYKLEEDLQKYLSPWVESTKKVDRLTIKNANEVYAVKK